MQTQIIGLDDHCCVACSNYYFVVVWYEPSIYALQALFKARFEQALESQKLNIKKTEQQLRRTGVNPEDPVAMASIQRVASTFFNAIDKKKKEARMSSMEINNQNEGLVW